MTKHLLLITSILFLLILNSCSVSKSKSSTIKTMDVDLTGILQKPLIVDLDVKDTKVTGTAIENIEESTTESVKQQAVADAVKKANADILVEPMFTIETLGNKITVSVTGFPANYKNFRSFKPEDTLFFNIGRIKKANVYQPNVDDAAPIKKNKTALYVTSGLLLITLIGLFSYL